MTYDVYRYIFIGAAVACGVFLLTSILLFFTLRIPKVIGDLTGRTARKAIENIRMQNELSGDKTYQSSKVNLERGKLTDKISQSGRLLTLGDSPFGTGVITEKISTQELPVDDGTGETEVLSSEETTLLSAGETTVLSAEVGETTLPSLTNGETSMTPFAEQSATASFVLEYEITFIHTNEVIS